MLKYGSFPYLECSSKGDKRFSAFYARIKSMDNKCIEEIYQCSKVVNGRKCRTWREGKGRRPENSAEMKGLYGKLWRIYFEENPELLEVIKKYNGFSDIFGKLGCNCQAYEIYKIRESLRE